MLGMLGYSKKYLQLRPLASPHVEMLVTEIYDFVDDWQREIKMKNRMETGKEKGKEKQRLVGQVAA